jgi:DNA-binding NarL/FixJ family response regulator
LTKRATAPAGGSAYVRGSRRRALVRGGFRTLLEAQEGITVVGESSDGAEAIELTHAPHP